MLNLSRKISIKVKFVITKKDDQEQVSDSFIEANPENPYFKGKANTMAPGAIENQQRNEEQKDPT